MITQHAIIHWIGIRKDSGRGSIWAWFTESDKPSVPIIESRYHNSSPEPVYCHVLWGRIGKKCYIEERDLTFDFIREVNTKANNFKQIEPEKIINRWGKEFDQEISMYLLMLKIKK